MAEDSSGAASRPKPRKLWIESTPFTPETLCAEKSPAPKLQLIHFAKKTIIDFGSVKVGRTAVKKLIVENPNPYEVDVVVEKFPWKKDFSVDQECFVIPEDNFWTIEITWAPKTSGNYRELVMIKYDTSYRVHALLVGNVESPKKKRGAKAMRRCAGNRKMMQRRAAMSSITAKSINDTENIDPTLSSFSQNDTTVDSKDDDKNLSSVKSVCNDTRSVFSPKENIPPNFTGLHSSLLQVLGNTQRDSCGSVTAPASPSGLEVPVIEDNEPHDVFSTDTQSPTNAVPQDETKSFSPESHGATFCVVSEVAGQSFTPQKVTGRPTFIMPKEGKDKQPVPSNIGKSAPVNNGISTDTENHTVPAKGEQNVSEKSRLYRRSRTFNKENIPSANVAKTKEELHKPAKKTSKGSTYREKMKMLDHALSVIAQPLESIQSQSENIDDNSSPCEQDSLESPKLHDVTESMNQIPTVKVTRTSWKQMPPPDTTQKDKAVENLLSSTQSHEKTLNYDGLPVPDISAITFPSPSKTTCKRKSDDEQSPFLNDPTTRAKRRSVEANSDPKATSPSTRQRRRPSASHGTPKGRALQRRRAARASEGFHLGPRPGSAKKKLRPSPSSNRRRTTNFSPSTSLVGAKRAAKLQDKNMAIKKKRVQTAQPRLVLKPTKPQTQPKKPRVRVSLAYTSRSMFYDERWHEKQEFAFTCWLNYILTPDEFKLSLESNESKMSSSKKSKAMHHSTVFGQTMEKSSLNTKALTKEDASMRAYQMQRRLNRLRRAACKLFESDDFIQVVKKIEEAVGCEYIKVREDKHLWADLGQRSNVLSLLMSFNSLWLRVGLEATFGEALPLQHGIDDISGLTNFITGNLLNSEHIQREFAHPTVPNLFRPGYEAKMAKHTLKKFLILILFIDQAKQNRLIDHDPCLFRKESNIRNCNEILVSFSRDLLQGEGDIVKHLSFMGYKVKHTQTYIDEFDCGISNICIDLRDGIRLVRVVELLFHDENLTSKVRAPAGSLLQKRHNVGIALKALTEHNVNVSDASGKKVEADHIVKGNREMTLSLLWNIAAHFQLVTAIDKDLLKSEIEFLKRNLRLKHMLENTIHLYEEEAASQTSSSSATEEISCLLLEWSRLVCAFKSIAVHNFASSFSDGRVLACLISYYQSNLIHPSQINMTTTLSMREPDPMLDDSLCVEPTPCEETVIPTKQLLKNEKMNLKLVQQAAYELGGIPNLLRIDDISNTIPDDKVVRLLVSFLCTRLLDIRIEDRAARTIQVAWRAFVSQKKAREERRAEEKRIARQNEAAVVIQTRFKGYLQRQRFRRMKQVAVTLQKIWRSKSSSRPLRKKFLVMKASAVLIQSVYRGFQARKLAKTLRLEQEKRNAVATVIQAYWKGMQQRRHYIQQKESVVKLQKWIQAVREGRLRRQEYLDYKLSVFKIQQKWRATLHARKQAAIFSTKRESAILIQKKFRAYLKRRQDFASRLNAAVLIQQKWRATMLMKRERSEYMKKQAAAITIQSFFRSFLAINVVEERRRELKACVFLQRKWRATVQMQSERSTYLKKRSSVIAIQSAFRRYLAVRLAKEMRRQKAAAILIQARWRAFVAMRKDQAVFLKKKSSVMSLQRAVRCFLAKRLVEQKKKVLKATRIIQARWRATKLMRENRERYALMRSAAIALQCWFRCQLAVRLVLQKRRERAAAVLVQLKWRAHMAMRKERSIFLEKKASAIRLQCAFRCFQARKVLLRKREELNAALIIQARWIAVKLMREKRVKFVAMRSAAVTLQCWIRCCLAKKVVERKRRELVAVLVLQEKWRATQAMKKQRKWYLKQRGAVTTLQCAFRCFVARKLLQKKRTEFNAALLIQRKWRATLLMRNVRREFEHKRSSAIAIQCAYRRYLAIKVVQKKRKELQAVLVIQRKLRATLLMQKVRDSYEKMKFSAVAIQCFVRRHQARRRLDELRKQRNAAIVIQTRWRATKEMQLQRQDYLRKRSAAVTIQCAIRRMIAQNVFTQKRMENYAAVLIQCWWRATVMMKKERSLFKCKRASSIVIQCAVRRHQAVQLADHKRKVLNAALVLQGRWKATLLMRKERLRFVEKRAAAVVIQCAFRRYLAVRLVENRRKQVNAAVTIQRWWWATRKMREERKAFENLKSAAITLQCGVRSWIARKILLRKRREFEAVVLIQRKWRAAVMMEKQRAEFKKIQTATLVIQCAIRCFMARRTVEQKQKMLNAVLKIQRKWRATLLARNQRDAFLLLRSSAIEIQSGVRRFIAKRLVARKRLEHRSASIRERRRHNAIRLKLQKQRQHEAAVVLQCRWRSTVAMRKEREDYLNLRSCSIAIQCWVRRLISVKLLKEKQRQRKAIICIQRRWKATLLMRKERSVHLQKINSILVLQRSIRCLLARRRLAEKKRFLFSVLMIQRRWKATLAMRRVKLKYHQNRSAAITIQSAFRCRLAVLKKRRLLRAITTIQHRWKATLKMRTERNHFINIRLSAVVIQCAVRCWIARKRMAKVRQENNSAILIQHWWKATVSMRRQRSDFKILRSAAITIQCAYRVFVATKLLNKMRKEKHSVLTIQRQWRATRQMRKERETYLKMQTGAVTIQSAVRCYLARILSAEQRRERRVIVRLQRRWRAQRKMKQERALFLLKRSAAITIQTAFLRYWEAKVAAEKHKQKVERSTRLIQRVYRGYVVRKQMNLHEEITQARERCQKANLQSAQNPEHRIGPRMKLALNVLLDIRLYSRIYGSLETLYNLSHLLPQCCERISDAGGTEVLCCLIDSSNRSCAAAVVHKLSLKILLNLVRNPTTRDETLQVLKGKGKKRGPEPVELLVNELSRFRDKSGRDPTHAPIFCAACELLTEFCSLPENIQVFKSNKRLVDMIRYVHKETMNRYKNKEQIVEAARLKKQREAVSYLAISCDTSNLLDVTTRECSFVRGYKRNEKNSSTPKKKKEKIEEKVDAGMRSRGLYGNAPPKIRPSLVPQRPLNIGVRIPRSKKSTKPQSPNFQVAKGKRSKTAPTRAGAVGGQPISWEEKDNPSSDGDNIRPQSALIRVNYHKSEEELCPMDCIEELFQILQ